MEKQLKVLLGSCNRLKKEIQLYHKEADEQKKHIESLKEKNADPYDINKQQQVLEETLNIIPHCNMKLNESVEQLEQLIVKKYFKITKK
jgi:tubulin-specific chaperone A